MTLRKVAGLLIVASLSIGLIGAGVSASFSDSATAAMSVHVGTFNIDISSTQADAVVASDGTSVTWTAPEIQSSAPGSSTFPFRITSTGSIPATISVAAIITGSGPFTDALVGPGPFTLTTGQSHDFTGGLAWTELFHDDLGTAHTITYTISASE